METVALLVIAKEPLPGRAKTRLTPPCTPAEAAALARAALLDTIDVVSRTPAARRVLVFDGDQRDWRPYGFELVAQRGDGLGERLAAAFADVGTPALLVGMDTPQLTPELLEAVARPLVRGDADAVFGPAQDGGFWLLGLRRPDPSLVLGVPMSVPHTGRVQLARLTQAGLRVSLMPELVDVDTVDDARLVASQAPDSRFAATLRGLDADASRLVSLGSAG